MLRLTTPDDAEAIHALRDALARWQGTLGIAQWMPGEIPLPQFEKQVKQGDWWVLDEPGAIVAAVRVTYDDPAIWSNSDGTDAGYIHGLMVSRARAGEGLGAAVLREAEGIVLSSGRRVARLDCVASNGVLRRYYEGLGYQLVGERTFPPGSGWLPVALFEKRLGSPSR